MILLWAVLSTEQQQMIVADHRDGSQVLARSIKRTSSLQAPTMQLQGHEDSVLSCRFNPEGTHLISAGKDRNICQSSHIRAGGPPVSIDSLDVCFL